MHQKKSVKERDDFHLLHYFFLSFISFPSARILSARAASPHFDFGFEFAFAFECMRVPGSLHLGRKINSSITGCLGMIAWLLQLMRILMLSACIEVLQLGLIRVEIRVFEFSCCPQLHRDREMHLCLFHLIN